MGVEGWPAGAATERSALGTVFAIGGADGWEPNDEVQKFSVENNWWDETTSIPTARYGHAAVGVDNFCFVFGNKPATTNTTTTMPPLSA